MAQTIEWKKRAAAQGQSLEDVEKAFLDSAYMMVQAKAAPISLRLTPAERAVVQQAANRTGKKLSDWCRQALIGAANESSSV